MKKLKMVRKTKPEKNQVVDEDSKVHCGLPDCNSVIQLSTTLPSPVVYDNIKVGICPNTVWICDPCRDAGRLKEVRKIANEHILGVHLIRDFFPNI
jgi:hypothetical protein